MIQVQSGRLHDNIYAFMQYVNEQCRPCSDCANMEADLNLSVVFCSERTLFAENERCASTQSAKGHCYSLIHNILHKLVSAKIPKPFSLTSSPPSQTKTNMRRHISVFVAR